MISMAEAKLLADEYERFLKNGKIVVEYRYPRGELERKVCESQAEAESLMEIIRKQGGYARIEGSRK